MDSMDVSASSNGFEMPSETVYQQLIEHALQSETFEHCPVTRSLLKYLYENRNQIVSEYAIATEILARRSDFDPKSDSYVRVQIARLRAKLLVFTEKEGNRFPVQIVLPRGSYNLEFADRPISDNLIEHPGSAPSVPESARDQRPEEIRNAGLNQQRLVRILSATVGILILMLVTLLVWVWIQMGARKISLQSARTNTISSNHLTVASDSFWGRFLHGGRPIRIIIPNPVFFYWNDPVKKEEVQVRSIGVNDFSEIEHSDLLKELTHKYGHPPSLSQEYLSIYDDLASLKLVSFLDQAGTTANVSDGSHFPAGSIDQENLILIGTVNTLHPYQKYLKNMTLSFNSDPVKRMIVSKDPVTGKEVDYGTVNETGEHFITPELLACVPTNGVDGRLMVIEGYKENALVSYLTSQEGQDELQRMQSANGGNPYYEAVIMSEINGSTPLRSRIAYYRALPAPH